MHLIYILIPYWMAVSLQYSCAVRYRNHFPVVRFQNQAHIWNPHGTGHVFKTIWGALGTPIFFYRHRKRRKLKPRAGRPKYGAPMAPRFFFLSPPPKAAVSEMGTAGAQRWHRRSPKVAPKKPKGGHSPGGRGKSR